MLAVASLMACGAGVTEADGVEIDQTRQAIQRDYIIIDSQTSTQRWANLLLSDSMSDVGKSTGALLGTSSNAGGTFHYSCGVTFISPQYAVTAAHCLTPPVLSLVVKQYNTTNLNVFAVQNQATVSGTWPNWTHPTLTTSNGYDGTSYTCTPFVGCSDTYYRTDNCPLAAPVDLAEVDIALIQCASRKTNAIWGNSWVAVNGQDKSNAEVQLWWFHEVYLLETQPGAGPGPSGNWTNYGSFGGDGDQNNYHYRVAHQLLPLRSTTWPDGTFYKQVGHVSTQPQLNDSDSWNTKIDLPVCHGASGSGVFERGTSGLFGPMATNGADSSTETRLCEDMANKTPGNDLMRHARRVGTVALENMAEVQNDRM